MIGQQAFEYIIFAQLESEKEISQMEVQYLTITKDFLKIQILNVE